MHRAGSERKRGRESGAEREHKDAEREERRAGDRE